MKIGPKDLNLLLVLAEELHFGRASERLACSQPQLSTRLAHLERVLGLTLFTRRPRVALTAAGEILVDAARRTQAEFASAVRRAQAAAQVANELVVLGFTSTAILTRLPERLGAFRSRHPEIQLRLREMHSAQLSEALDLGIIDVAITREVRSRPTVASTVLFSEPLLAALPPAHPLGQHSELDVGRLEGEPFILSHTAGAPSLNAQIIGLCTGVGFEPSIAQEVDDWQSVLALVRGGFGVSIVPQTVVRISPPEILLRPLAGSPSTDTFLCHRRIDRQPGTQALIDWLQASPLTGG